MKGVPRKADPPFSRYTLYGPVMDRREGRRKVFLVHRTNGSRTTMTLARYRMCVHLGRKLKRSEEVDHKDEDRLNDDLDNLQILSRKENTRKHAKHRGQAWLELRCPSCEVIFQRSKRATHLVKGGTFTACGRKCSGRLRALLQHHGMTPDLENAISKNVVREFRQH